MPKVSLIVPIYNTDRYLKRCINSIINQTLKDIEIILINDGSSDESDNIVKSFNDKRIKYINKENEGIGKTRNLGINESTGDFIAFVDSDDYISKSFCEHLYNRAIKSKSDIVVCDYFEDRGYIKEIRFSNFDDTNIIENPRVLNNINLGPCNKLYSSKLIKDNNIRFEENLKYEDVPFVIKSLKHAKNISKLNECLTYYVIHENSQTTIRDNKMFDIFKIVDIIVEELNGIDKEVVTNLVVMIITDYTVQQRYIHNKSSRNKFINEAFNYLNNLDNKWKSSCYLKKIPYLKRLVKTNKILTKIYCSMYVRLKNI